MLLRDLVAEFDLSMLFVTHDFGVVPALCEVSVIYAGRPSGGADATADRRGGPSYARLLLACHPDRATDLGGIGSVPSRCAAAGCASSALSIAVAEWPPRDLPWKRLGASRRGLPALPASAPGGPRRDGQGQWLLQVRSLVTVLAAPAVDRSVAPVCAPSMASTSKSRAARSSGWWAKAAVASRPRRDPARRAARERRRIYPRRSRRRRADLPARRVRSDISTSTRIPARRSILVVDRPSLEEA
jgi:hypothetical protein